LILMTPDAERTMNAFLEVAAEVLPSDVSEELVAAAAITFVEGFLCGVPATQAALEKAVSLAGRTALTLSDAFWVEGQRTTFLDLVKRVEIVFANTTEVCRLYDTDKLDIALSRLADDVPLAAV